MPLSNRRVAVATEFVVAISWHERPGGTATFFPDEQALETLLFKSDSLGIEASSDVTLKGQGFTSVGNSTPQTSYIRLQLQFVRRRDGYN